MKKQKEQHLMELWYKGEDIGALWREEQKRKKRVNLNFKFFALWVMQMILILGSFVSCVYVLMFMSELLFTLLWFGPTFFSLMSFSYILFKNMDEISKEINNLNNE